MKSIVKALIFIILAITLCCKPLGKKPDNEVRVFCAVSLTNVITELKDSFMLHNPATVKLNLASSGTLARQIEQGNVADIFISASEEWAGYVESLNLFSPPKPLYQNKLVIIAPKSGKLDTIHFERPISHLFTGYLSMGDPAHVPAGRFAYQALSALGWYQAIEKRILPAKDVRSALMVMEMGECELGIVYYSDAIQSDKVKILGIFPEKTHQPVILYALLAKSANEASKEFYKLLSDEVMQLIWLKNGFTPLDTGTKP